MSQPSASRGMMATLARRAAMTEGQLYTVVIAVLAVLLLTLTGLPNDAPRDPGQVPGRSPAGEVAP